MLRQVLLTQRTLASKQPTLMATNVKFYSAQLNVIKFEFGSTRRVEYQQAVEAIEKCKPGMFQFVAEEDPSHSDRFDIEFFKSS